MKFQRVVVLIAVFALSQFVSHRVLGQSIKQRPTKQIADHGRDNDKPVDVTKLRKPVLWHDPGEISTLNLCDGQGGREGQPVGPFKFESEDLQGTNPKFDVRDAKDTRWRVKLGDEARPEVVASRLLWAVGYFVDDDYLIESATVQGLRVERGGKWIKGQAIRNGRFEKRPDHEKKIGIWRWKANPFTGSREFNGLRVMMAVMNNWDLKDVNNAVYSDKSSSREIFVPSDIGATFGTNGVSLTKERSKGDVDTFERSKFIVDKSDKTVNFGTPAAPVPVMVINAKTYMMRHDLEWIGKGIPISDARWIGSLLKQLTHQQLVDAFRAGHFPADESDRYVTVLEQRIQELSGL